MPYSIPDIPDIPTVDDLLKAYNALPEFIEIEAEKQKKERGGIERGIKGPFVEAFTRGLIKRAWDDLKGDRSDLKVKGSVTVPLKEGYLKRIQDNEIADYIKKNIQEYSYTFRIDVPVCIKDKLVMVVECKSYADNAMIKRTLHDGAFIKRYSPDTEIVLLQFKSGLGGDYHEIFREKHFGSTSTHTIMSYFDYTPHIITLLEEKRKSSEPFHKKDFFKPMKREALEKALAFFRGHLKKHC